MLLQDTLFAAANPASAQGLKPVAILSFSTDLLHVSLGLPLLRFPSGAHVRATRGRQLLSMCSTCPIHVLLLFLTSSLMVLASSGALILSTISGALILSTILVRPMKQVMAPLISWYHYLSKIRNQLTQ